VGFGDFWQFYQDLGAGFGDFWQFYQDLGATRPYH